MRTALRRTLAAAFALAAIAGVAASAADAGRSYTGGNFQADGPGSVQVSVTDPAGNDPSLITSVGFPKLTAGDTAKSDLGPDNFQAKH